jgi:16S rRNA (adenine1518-N6/adenine1519-N6)-dimethyltransferase
VTARGRADARAVLRAAGLAPKKRFGQNFLVTDRVVQRVATTCVPDAEVGRARVIELGAGLGALTSELATRAAHVIAVERDRDLVPLLRSALAEAIAANVVEILEADAQTLDVSALLANAPATRVLAGNLPYQITGRLLTLAVEAATHVDRVVFMVQEEVADRLLALPATKEYGALTVFVRAAFDVARAMTVAPGSFYPPPGVTSTVVVLTPHPRARETPELRALVKAAFGARRKTLRNAWRPLFDDADALARFASGCGISLDARGETLDVEDFARAASALTLRTDAPSRRAR